MIPIEYFYDDSKIEFELKQGKNMMVNATVMAKKFGKNVGHFLENDTTHKFINSCLNNRNSDYLGVKNRDDLIISKQNSGTWMHRILALKFAAWLSPDFEVWVFITIDQILNDYANKHRGSLSNSIQYKNEINQILSKKTKTSEDFERYIELVDLLKKERSNRTQITKKEVDAIQSSLFLDLFPDKNNTQDIPGQHPDK